MDKNKFDSKANSRRRNRSKKNKDDLPKNIYGDSNDLGQGGSNRYE